MGFLAAGLKKMLAYILEGKVRGALEQPVHTCGKHNGTFCFVKTPGSGKILRPLQGGP